MTQQMIQNFEEAFNFVINLIDRIFTILDRIYIYNNTTFLDFLISLFVITLIINFFFKPQLESIKGMNKIDVGGRNGRGK